MATDITATATQIGFLGLRTKIKASPGFRKRRHARHLTQVQLATAAGCSKKHINEVEQGLSALSPRLAQHLAQLAALRWPEETPQQCFDALFTIELEQLPTPTGPVHRQPPTPTPTQTKTTPTRS